MAKAARRVRDGLRVYLRAYPTGRVWWAARGRQRVSLGLAESDAERAEAYRIACERFAADGLAAGVLPATEPDLEVIARAYVAENDARWKPSMRVNVGSLLPRFVDAMRAAGCPRASDVTDDVVAAWIAGRQRDVSNATINRMLMLARRMVRWARRRSPPLLEVAVPLERAERLKEIRRQRAPLIPSPAEWTRVVSALATEPLANPANETPRWRERHAANARGIALLVVVAVQTGMRLDELRHLRTEDVGADEVRVTAWGTWSPKSRHERTIPVPAATAVHAREFVAWRDVAVGQSGKRIVLGEHWLAKRLDAAWSRARLPGDAPRMHDCRRTFATELVRAGQPLTIVRDRMGHGDVATTERSLGRYRSDRERAVPDRGVGAALDAGPVAGVIAMRRGR